MPKSLRSYVWLRVGMLLAALAAVAISIPRTFFSLTANDWIALGVALVFFVVLLRINVPAISAVYGKQRNNQPGRLTLELPVVLTVFALYGPIAAAALQLCGYPLAISYAFVWLCLGIVRPFVLPRIPQLNAAGFAQFLAYYVCGILAFLFLLWLPLKALNEPVSVVRLWRNFARDTRLMTYTVLVVSWAYVCISIWERAGMALGLVCFAPLPLIARAASGARAAGEGSSPAFGPRCRASDAARIGGEEFVVLMPDTTSEMARSVGERLRAAIEQAQLRHAGGESVTASIGVAVASVSDTVASLLARADSALYEAKRQGRNRVVELGA